MNLEPKNEDYQELLKDERARMLFNNIVLMRNLKEALATIEELKKNQKLSEVVDSIIAHNEPGL